MVRVPRNLWGLGFRLQRGEGSFKEVSTNEFKGCFEKRRGEGGREAVKIHARHAVPKRDYEALKSGI